MTKSKGKKKWIFVSIFVLASVLAVVALIFSPRVPRGKEIQAKAGDISTYYSFSGSINAKNRQDVFAQSAMQITELKVSDGDIVKEDDVLFVTSTGERVKANINGEVLLANVQENELVMPGTKIFQIVDYSDLQLTVQIDEYDLEAVKEGVKAAVTVHALSRDIEGTVTKVSKEGNYQGGVTFFTADISLQPDRDIRVGMSAEAKILKNSALNVVLLPMSAVQFDDYNNPFVYIKNRRKLEEKYITLGITDGVNVEIKEGLSAGDTVFVPERDFVFGRPVRIDETSTGGHSVGTNS